MRAWTDKDGNKRRNAEVLADNVYFADSKNAADNGNKDATAATTPAAYSFSTATQAAAPAGNWTHIDDDAELPF
jgi:single-strand DNA-binding protein